MKKHFIALVFSAISCWLFFAISACSSISSDDDATTDDDSTAADDDTTAGNDDTAADDDTTADDDSTAPVVPTFAEIAANVFAVSCTPCHTTSTSGGLSLAEGAAYGNLVGAASSEAPAVDLVEPGEPEQSYLIAKLKGTQTDLNGYGEQMPKGKTPLDEETISGIEAWIAAGALDN
jgi:cytochrome c5